MSSSFNHDGISKKPPPLPPRPRLPSHPSENEPTVDQKDAFNKVSLGSSQNAATDLSGRNVSSDHLSHPNSNVQSVHPIYIASIQTQPEESNPSSGSLDRQRVDLINGNPTQPESSTLYLSDTQADTMLEHLDCPETSPEKFAENRLDSSPHLDYEDGKLDEIEELEVDEFLRRSCKYLDQVEIQTTESTENSDAPLPKISQFRLNAGLDSSSTDWIGFLDALLLSQLKRFCPNVLRSNPTPPPVSISQIRSQASRSFATIFPELQRISSHEISSIYRWEKPRQTAFYLSIYYALWFADLIPSFIVGYGIYLLIVRQLNPPTVSQLKHEVNQRHELSQQAEVMASEGLFGTKTGAIGSIAKGVMAHSIMFAGAAVGANTGATNGTSSVLESTNKPSSNPPPLKIHSYRSLYALSRGLYAHYGLEIQFLLADLADISEKFRNLYLWRRPHACRRTTFMLIGILVYTMLVSQKWLVKNFLGWLGLQFFFIFQFTEKNPEFRKVSNPIWLLLYEIPTDAEFALEILQKRGKLNKPLKSSSQKIKRSSHHFNSGPNSSKHNSIQSSSKSIQRENLDNSYKSPISTLQNVLEADNFKQLGHKIMGGSNGAIKLVKRICVGDENHQSVKQPSSDIDSNLQNPSVDVNSTSHVKLKTFAMLRGKVPGNLLVKKEGVCFEPMKGFRTKSLNIKASLSQQSSGTKGLMRTASSASSKDQEIQDNAITVQEDVSVLSNDKKVVTHAHQETHNMTKSCSDLGDHEDTDFDLIIPLNQILKIKKVKKSLLFGVGFRISDGIEFNLHNSSVVSFDNIINRDEYFNQLVTICHMIDHSS